MTRIHTRHNARSRPTGIVRRWGWILTVLGTCAALAPAAASAAASTTGAVTDATTGLPNSSSVVALDACGAPSALRAACLAKVLGVRGTHSLVHPRLRQAASPDRLDRRARRRGARAAASTFVVPAAAAPQPGTPAYLQQAYDLAYLAQTAGGTATVAIVDAYDAPNAEADLAAYRAKFSLPACSTANGCFTKVNQSGGTTYPSTRVSGWEVETSLDLDAVSALCPNCHIVLVEADSNALTDLAAAQATAAGLGAGAISDSWGVDITGPGAAASFNSLGTFTFPGITTVAAAGDDGYLGAGTNDYPAALGDVTAAGGTTLVPGDPGSARGFDESAWSGAGSGCATDVSKPSWQAGIGCAGRAYTDLSADADPNTGMQVYDSADGGWVVVGGTSEATPLIAAYYALVGASGQGPAWAYANAALLNDPSSGSNGSCAFSLSFVCDAGAGYDGATGEGSISGALAAGAPGIGGPGSTSSYAQAVSTDTAELQGGVYPNGTDTTYWWEYGTTTAYGEQTTAADIGAGEAPVAASGGLTDLDPGTTYHYRLVAQNSFGTEYGYDFTLKTPTGTAGSPTHGLNPPDATIPPATTTPPAGTTPPATITPPATPTPPATITPPPTTTPPPATSTPPPSNTASSTSTAIGKTSPVAIVRVTVRGGKLQVVIRCRGAAICRARLQAHVGSRLIASGKASVRGNRTTTVTLRLSAAARSALAPRSGRRAAAKLSVLSAGSRTVTATIPRR